VHLGSGLVRGVRSYLDVKERGCREFGNAPNPACVVTGDEGDGNVYELYLVHGDACLGALLGELRFLAMAPDAVVLDIAPPETCDAVRRVARHVLGEDVQRCSVLAVVSAVQAQPSFVRTPSSRSDGVTDFASGVELARRARGLLTPKKGLSNVWLGGRGARLNARLSETDASNALAAAGLTEAAAALTKRRAPPPLGAVAAAAAVAVMARRAPTGVAAFAAGAIVSTVAHRFLAQRAVKQVWAAARREARPGAADAPQDASISCHHGRHFSIARCDTAVVCIDLQRDFVEATGRIGSNYADLRSVGKAVERAADLLKAARAAGLTVAHSRSHRYGASIRDDLIGDPGYELCDQCRALPGEIVVDKWTFGAFASTDLERQLRRRGVRRILLCGVLTNVCVMATAVQAADRFFRVCLVEGACAAFDESWHAKALDLLNEPQVRRGHADQPVGLYFGEVASTTDVSRALSNMNKIYVARPRPFFPDFLLGGGGAATPTTAPPAASVDASSRRARHANSMSAS